MPTRPRSERETQNRVVALFTGAARQSRLPLPRQLAAAPKQAIHHRLLHI